MKFAFVAANRAGFSVEKMCGVLDISRSGFYASVGRPPSRRARQNEHLVAQMRKIHQERRGVYGSPRMTKELLDLGLGTSENRVASLMRKSGISGRNPRTFRVQTTDSNHDFPIATNLVDQNFRATDVNEVWLSDITYIDTAEGWTYLCAIKDIHSAEIIGWALDDHMRTDLVLTAFRRAVRSKQPPSGVIFHSDRGVQYASTDFRTELKGLGFIQSMSGKGNCYDNAPMESFFGTLKVEEVYRRRYANLDDAKRNLFDYIEVFYNRKRRHSRLGYLSPAEFLRRKMA